LAQAKVAEADLYAVFNLLVGLEILDRNPITRVKFPELKELPRDRVLTREERLRVEVKVKVLHFSMP